MALSKEGKLYSDGMEPDDLTKIFSRAINDAYYARDNWKRLWWQILIATAITGIVTTSWIWFGVALVGLLVALRIPYIGAILCVLLGVGVGVAIGILAEALGGITCGWVIGILATIFMTFCNLSGRST